MKMLTGAVRAGLVGLGVGVTACGAAPVTVMQSPPAHSATAATATPAITKTVIKYRTATAAPPTAPSTAAAAPPATTAAPAPPQQPADQNVTDPWAVVSAYYGDIESGNYQQAYALIGNGATTGQTYQEFVVGFACTGSQSVSENLESGDQVNFNLVATDSCIGAIRYYTGTDTVRGGVIVGADVVQTGLRQPGESPDQKVPYSFTGDLCCCKSVCGQLTATAIPYATDPSS